MAQAPSVVNDEVHREMVPSVVNDEVRREMVPSAVGDEVRREMALSEVNGEVHRKLLATASVSGHYRTLALSHSAPASVAAEAEKVNVVRGIGGVRQVVIRIERLNRIPSVYSEPSTKTATINSAARSSSSWPRRCVSGWAAVARKACDVARPKDVAPRGPLAPIVRGASDQRVKTLSRRSLLP